MSKVVYAIGDIHGRKDLLVALRKLIVEDANQRGFDERKIVYLGDYVDRGLDSKGVIDLLMNRPLDGFENICLKGNHEEIMYKAVEWSTRGTGSRTSWSSWVRMWTMNGGWNTLESYGVNRKDVADGKIQWQDIQTLLPMDHIYWMKALPSSHVDGKYFFVHAGVSPETDLFNQKQEIMLWIRDKFLHHIGPFTDHMGNEYKIIHGHTPTRNGQVDMKHNRINLDTGACWLGKMHALAIHDDEERIISTPQFDRLSDMEQR